MAVRIGSWGRVLFPARGGGRLTIGLWAGGPVAIGSRPSTLQQLYGLAVRQIASDDA